MQLHQQFAPPMVPNFQIPNFPQFANLNIHKEPYIQYINLQHEIKRVWKKEKSYLKEKPIAKLQNFTKPPQTHAYNMHKSEADESSSKNKNEIGLRMVRLTHLQWLGRWKGELRGRGVGLKIEKVEKKREGQRTNMDSANGLVCFEKLTLAPRWYESSTWVVVPLNVLFFFFFLGAIGAQAMNNWNPKFFSLAVSA